MITTAVRIANARRECRRWQAIHTARPSRANLDQLNAAYARLFALTQEAK